MFSSGFLILKEEFEEYNNTATTTTNKTTWYFQQKNLCLFVFKFVNVKNVKEINLTGRCLYYVLLVCVALLVLLLCTCIVMLLN